MTKRILVASAASVALAVPAIAIAQKFPSSVSANLSESQNQIYGVVQSDDYACEKRRVVRLYGPDFDNKSKGVQTGFRRIDETKTNRFGEYEFFAGTNHRKRGEEQSEFFVRAIRKDFPGNACRRADSNSVFIEFEPPPP